MKKFNVYNQIISCIFFSLLGFQVKLLSEQLNIETIVFFRSLIGLIIILAVSLILKKSIKIIRTTNIRIHLLRSIFGIFAMYFGYRSLNYISLSEATSIGFTKVFFTSLLAFIFLKEKLNKSSFFYIDWFFRCVFNCFTNKNNKPYWFIYECCLCNLCGRRNYFYIFFSQSRKYSNSYDLSFFFSSIVFLTFFINKIEFDFYQNFFGIILLTITALLGQYFNSESYKYGKANTVVILSYSRIVFSTLLGFFFLSEKVSFITMIGILLIVLTTYFVKKKKN